MKILLLGSNGQLGSDILKANQSNSVFFDIVPWQRDNLDVADKEALKTKLRQQSFDILINCTSFLNTEKAETNIETAFIINAFSVKEMALICKEKNAKFFHISTDYVFSHSPDFRPLTESSSPAPLNIYGTSKLMGETLAQAVYNNIVIFRVASLFGVAGASGKGGNFVETIIRLHKEKKELRIISDQIMSPTSTADIAHAILKAVSKNIPNGIYHAVNSGQASWYEFAKKILSHIDEKTIITPILATEYSSAILRPTYSALDNNKLTHYIGPISTWEEALNRYLHQKGHIKNV